MPNHDFGDNNHRRSDQHTIKQKGRSAITTTSVDILQTRARLAAAGNRSATAVVGFDGFVDEIIEVVDKRISTTTVTRIDTIASFGERISKAAGLSTNIELVPRAVKLGGNGPIMATALGAAGVAVTYIGALGKEAIHPVFADLTRVARTISIADPAHTDALEFSDGKVMLGKLAPLNDVIWENLTAALPVEQLRSLVCGAQLIATVNWTMLPHMTSLWQHLLDEVVGPAELPAPPIIFFDLADPEKRHREEIAAALEIIRRFNGSCRAILGLNRKEATAIAATLGLDAAANASLAEITCQIAAALGIYGLVVHPTAQAAAVVAGESALVDGPYTSRPRLTTGAGDNFNAGFCLGQLLGLDARDSLIVGVGTSGFYVRHGRSPSRPELLSFLQHWAERAGTDFD